MSDLCPDCGRPRVSERSYPPDSEDAQRYCWRGWASDLAALPRCQTQTITRLRQRVAELEGELAHEKACSPVNSKMFIAVALETIADDIALIAAEHAAGTSDAALED